MNEFGSIIFKKRTAFLDEFIPQVIDKLSDELTEELILESKLADKVLIASGSHDFLVKNGQFGTNHSDDVKL